MLIYVINLRLLLKKLLQKYCNSRICSKRFSQCYVPLNLQVTLMSLKHLLFCFIVTNCKFFFLNFLQKIKFVSNFVHFPLRKKEKKTEIEQIIFLIIYFNKLFIGLSFVSVFSCQLYNNSQSIISQCYANQLTNFAIQYSLL